MKDKRSLLTVVTFSLAAICLSAQNVCSVSETLQQSMQAQEFLMNRRSLFEQPRIGIVYKDNMTCTLKEYLLHFMVRFIDVAEDFIIDGNKEIDPIAIKDIMQTISSLEDLDKSAFVIKIGSASKDVLSRLETHIDETQKSLDGQLVVLYSNDSKIYSPLNSWIQRKSILFVHSSIEDLTNLKYFVKPNIYNINQDSSVSKDALTSNNVGLKIENLKYSNEGCSSSSYNFDGSLSFAYISANTSFDNANSINNAYSCDMTVILNSKEDVIYVIQNIFMFVQFGAPLQANSSGCFYVQKVWGPNNKLGQLMFSFSQDCESIDTGRYVLCRNLTSQSVSIDANNTNVKNLNTNDFCGAAALSSPQSIKEAIFCESMVSETSIKDGIWISLKYDGTSNGPNKWSEFTTPSHESDKLLVIVGVTTSLLAIAVLMAIILRRVKGSSSQKSSKEPPLVLNPPAEHNKSSKSHENIPNPPKKIDGIITQQLQFEEASDNSIEDNSLEFNEEHSMRDAGDRESHRSTPKNVDFKIEFSHIGNHGENLALATSQRNLDDSD